jgi:hypothetical protein
MGTKKPQNAKDKDSFSFHEYQHVSSIRVAYNMLGISRGTVASR